MEIAIGIIISLCFFSFLIFLSKKNEKRNVVKPIQKREISTNDPFVSMEIEEKKSENKHVTIYLDDQLSKDETLLHHTLQFVGSYIYPKKSFKHVSIERKDIPSQTSVTVYTDSEEMYMLSFNPQYRVIGFKKKGIEAPFQHYISNKEKQTFYIEKHAN